MREILFRGLDIRGVWHEGLLAHVGNAWYISNSAGIATEVIPASIGQFTGLYDKNGKRIFEGDIVKHYNNSDDGFDIGALYLDETFSQWKRTSIGNFHSRDFTYRMSRSCEYEVIGNIHDNPKLLKGGEGDG